MAHATNGKRIAVDTGSVSGLSREMAVRLTERGWFVTDVDFDA